jgi:hypothetical protein
VTNIREAGSPTEHEVDAVAGRLFRIFDDVSAGREPLHDFEVLVYGCSEYLENWRALAREAMRLGLRLDGSSPPGEAGSPEEYEGDVVAGRVFKISFKNVEQMTDGDLRAELDGLYQKWYDVRQVLVARVDELENEVEHRRKK